MILEGKRCHTLHSSAIVARHSEGSRLVREVRVVVARAADAAVLGF